MDTLLAQRSLTVGRKDIKCAVLQNQSGAYLRLTELSNGRQHTIRIPIEGWRPVDEAVTSVINSTQPSAPIPTESEEAAANAEMQRWVDGLTYAQRGTIIHSLLAIWWKDGASLDFNKEIQTEQLDQVDELLMAFKLFPKQGR